MSSVGVNQVFSVPFCHLGSTHFASDRAEITTRPLGLARFVGDEPNQLLRYLAPENLSGGLAHANSRFQFPIVLYGPSGTGKTSLALTIVSAIISNQTENTNNPEVSVPFSSSSRSGGSNKKPVFLTSLDFDRRYRAALETDSISDFRKRLLQSGGLVIDDLHRWVDKPAVQTEFIQILDQSLGKNLPIVITLNISPQGCNGLSAKLVSRLSGGLSLPVNPPGPMARMEIIRDLARINQLELTEDAMALLVNRLNVTVPKLDHFFAQLVTRLKSNAGRETSGHCNVPINANALMQMFKKTGNDQEQLSLLITQRVAREFHLKVSELKGNSRKQSIVLARGIAIYLNRVLLGNSFLKIGACFGNRDHSTIMHAYRKIDRIVSHSDSDQDTTSTEIVVKKLKLLLSEQFASQMNFI